MTDRELLQTYAQSRSHEAFAELVRRHTDWIYSVALRLVRDPATAEDVVQAVFIVLANRAAKLSLPVTRNQWLFQVTRYTAIHALRDEARRKRREQQAADLSTAMREQSPQSADEWNQIVDVLDNATAKLSRSDRQAILLRFYERKTMADVGLALGISEEAARKRVGRAVSHLRALLLPKTPALPAASLADLLVTNATIPAPAALATAILHAASNRISATVRANSLARTTGRHLVLIQLRVAAVVALVALIPAAIGAAIVANTFKSPAIPAVPQNSAAVVVSMASTSEPAEEVPAEVKAAIDQCKATYESVENVSYHFTRQFRGSDGNQDQIGFAKQDGATLCEATNFTRTNRDRGNTETIIGYVGPTNCGFWSKNFPPASQYFYTDVRSIPRDVQVSVGMFRAPHPEIFAFGSHWIVDDFLWLNVAYLRDKGRVWTIEKIQRDNLPLLKLMSFQKNNAGKLSSVPITTFYLDPAKGNVVVEFEGRLDSGEVFWHTQISYADITGHGTWYPVKIFDRLPSRESNTVAIQIDQVSINPPFKDEDFSIQSLGLPTGQRLDQIDITGHRTEITWR
jgi:RNA polymerase sigma factor (sigma-70 family)